MYDLEKRRCTCCRSNRSVWLVWRVTIIEFRERTNSVFADILEEALNKIFCSSIICITHHTETYIDIRSKKIRECTTLVVCKVTIDLRAFINSPISFITR